MAERRGLEPPVPRAPIWAEFGAILAHYSFRIKTSVLERISCPGFGSASDFSGSLRSLGSCSEFGDVEHQSKIRRLFLQNARCRRLPPIKRQADGNFARGRDLLQRASLAESQSAAGTRAPLGRFQRHLRRVSCARLIGRPLYLNVLHRGSLSSETFVESRSYSLGSHHNCRNRSARPSTLRCDAGRR